MELAISPVDPLPNQFVPIVPAVQVIPSVEYIIVPLVVCMATINLLFALSVPMGYPEDDVPPI